MGISFGETPTGYCKYLTNTVGLCMKPVCYGYKDRCAKHAGKKEIKRDKRGRFRGSSKFNKHNNGWGGAVE